jgi:multidrug efflux pump subunit AcrB
VITWTLTLLLPVMGYWAYRGLPRLEDPEFAIKQAVVLTPYAGASAQDVEAEVTEKIEKAVQQLGQLKRVESYSERGLSRVKVLIKNAIVLVDQIEMEIRAGKPHFQAVVDSGVSRMMPVCMAAITTIMGMAPLLQDDFFVSMAVSIMFGLGFATLLTLIVVPVLYVIFFRIPYEAGPETVKEEICA